jgi:hypothetical protein
MGFCISSCGGGFVSDWISVDKRLPDIARPVWIMLDDGSAIIGGRGLGADGDWFWCNAYGSQYLDKLGNWCCTNLALDDEYLPTHWQPLPEPPK